MQENEFEAEWGNNMEGFGLEPSPLVWAAVERRIRKEKKRRVAFWFWFLLCLLAGGITTALLLNNKAVEKKFATSTQKNKLESTLPNPNNTAAIVPATQQKTFPLQSENKKAKKNTPVTKANQNLSNFKKELYPAVIPLANKTIPKNKTIKPTAQIPIKEVDFLKLENQQQQVNSLPKNRENLENKTSLLEDENKSLAITDKTEKKKLDVQNHQPSIAATDTLAASLNLADSLGLTVTDTLGKKINNWKWGLHFSAGKSGITDGIFNLSNKAFSSDLSNYPSTGSGQPQLFTASPVKPHLSWAAGMFIKKEFAKKLAITLGIDYNYLSTQINIGNRVDSTATVNNNFSTGADITYFYRPSTAAASHTYTNKFHFIGLSADLSWQIIRVKKFSLYWENGIAYNRLINANVLNFSNSLPGYYKDNTLLNRQQFIYKTGLLFPLSKSFILKPFLNYNLTTIFKNYTGSKAHFSTYGLQLKYFIKK